MSHATAPLDAVVAIAHALQQLVEVFDQITNEQCTTTLRIAQEAAAVASLTRSRSESSPTALLELKKRLALLRSDQGVLASAQQQLALIQADLSKHPHHSLERLQHVLYQVAASGVVASMQTDLALRQLDLAMVAAAVDEALQP